MALVDFVVQPIAKTRSCDAPHFQYHVAGVLRVEMDDGPSSIAGLAMFRCCLQGTTRG